MERKRILVVGGVAGGASAAARARRNDEAAEIIIYERGPHVSFANCGLPYFVGGVIQNEQDLHVSNPGRFLDQLRVEAKTQHDVTAIDRAKREIEVVNLATGAVSREAYDALVLSPGAGPIKPPFPGLDTPGIFTLRNIPDSQRIREWIAARQAKRAVVVGGGFIGLEMAENLHARGIEVTLVEAAPHVFPPLDSEMAYYVEAHLRAEGVKLHLGEAVQSFAPAGAGVSVQTAKGTYVADLVILAIGVKPETQLAAAAGLALGPRGGIQVDGRMRTSDPYIWAVGDAVEKVDAVTQAPALYALAGPANRQGRIAADDIAGRPAAFRGSQATAVCGVIGLTAAATGANERGLKAAGRPFAKAYLHPRDHARYYPGSQVMHLKVLFDPENGKLLGAQAVGLAGVERRIDIVAMALQLGGTVYDLEEAELAYAPQYGSAKDAVNFAGMIAANHLRGESPLAYWEALPAGAFVLDVREPGEFAGGHFAGAVNLPLKQVRERAGELPRDREIYVHCQVGQRAHYAVRALRQLGFKAVNLSGGFETYAALEGSKQAG
jgi:NADPH-dependent 2,4-dienoyl-CoA reductase/sulfur reductase-like enzyme/rhodanese-related sulfurtransferase